MLPLRKRVVVELTPSRLEVVLVAAGKPGAWLVERAESIDWDGAWPDVLENDTRLQEMAQRVGASGAHADVLYTGEHDASIINPCPINASSSDAVAAAELAVNTLVAHDVHDNPVSHINLRRDSAGDDPQQHVLIATDTERSSNALSAWIRRAGLIPSRMIPLQAQALHSATHALERSGRLGLSLVLWLGEHDSVLIAGTREQIAFSRSISVGTEQLVEALTRTIRTDTGQTQLSRDQARALLASAGLPRPDDVLDPRDGIRGASVLPLLSPVIQRLCVELKQSIRFGIDEHQRAACTMRLAGPGAHIPGLLRALTEQTGIAPEDNDEPVPRDAEPPTSHQHGALRALLDRPVPINLLPENLRIAGAQRRARAAIWVGAAAATIAIGVDASFNHERAEQHRAYIEQARPQLLQVQHAQNRQERALRSIAAGADLLNRVHERVGDQHAWAPTLAEIASRTPAQVRINELSIRPEGDRGKTLVLRGYVRAAMNADATRTIKDYIRSIEQIPVVGGAELGGTQSMRVQDLDVTAFTIRATPLPIPSDPLAGVDTPAQTGGTP